MVAVHNRFFGGGDSHFYLYDRVVYNQSEKRGYKNYLLRLYFLDDSSLSDGYVHNEQNRKLLRA